MQEREDKEKVVEEPGFEPGTFRMRSGHSTTELHPRCCEQGSKREDRLLESGIRGEASDTKPLSNHCREKSEKARQF